MFLQIKADFVFSSSLSRIKNWNLWQVKLVRLVGIMLIFYVKTEHAKFISEVEAETVGTGIMGRMVRSGATVLLLLCKSIVIN